MPTIKEDWGARYRGAVAPVRSNRGGWLVNIKAAEAFVEPELSEIYQNFFESKLIVVSAPGAVGKSTYARALAASTSCALVDLAQTEQVGGNFFTGGIANAFGFDALSAIPNGTLGLIVDALDEARPRAGADGITAGLLDLARIVTMPGALPATLFGRAAAAEEAWLILSDAGFHPCLLEIEYFNDAHSILYIEKKLPILASRRADAFAAFNKHKSNYIELARKTREKLVEVPGGGEPRFAGYAPVLDAICEFAMPAEDDDEGDGLNPLRRATALSSGGPVALVDDIANSILIREQKKFIGQLKKDGVATTGVTDDQLYMPAEQLGRVAATILGAPLPPGPALQRPDSLKKYHDFVREFAPGHPFLDSHSAPANAAFAAYLLFWALTSGYAPAQARKKLASEPSFSSGLLFELYMRWLKAGEDSGLRNSMGARLLPLDDVGPLYEAFASQSEAGQRATLDVTGEPNDKEVFVEFSMIPAEDGGVAIPLAERAYGPFASDASGILQIRASMSGIRVVAPIAMSIGDGKSAKIVAPAEIDVDILEINGRDLRVFRAAGEVDDENTQVILTAKETMFNQLESVVVAGGHLSASFSNVQAYPWTQYAMTSQPAPDSTIGELRRRLRRVLTAFRANGNSGLVRLAAKIQNPKTIGQGELGEKLLNQLLRDKVLTEFAAGRFYRLDKVQLTKSLGMSYGDLQRQQWTLLSDDYLARIGNS